MPEPTHPSRDPMIDEIRAIREKLWDDAGRDMQRYGEMLHQVQEQMRREGRLIVSPESLRAQTGPRTEKPAA